MGPNAIAALAGVKPKMLRRRGETAPNDLRKLEAHGKVLRRAAEIAGLTHGKTLADELGVSESSLSEWFAGNPHGGHPQTWRFQQHPRLGPALLVAQAEDETGVIVRHVIEVPASKVG